MVQIIDPHGASPCSRAQKVLGLLGKDYTRYDSDTGRESDTVQPNNNTSKMKLKQSQESREPRLILYVHPKRRCYYHPQSY